MKRTLPFFIFILTHTLQLKAQCTPGVPSNAVVVNSTQTINGGFDPIWVCSGDTLHSDGGFHNTFLETGSVMTTAGGIDTIYVKDGAAVFMTGGIHVIFFETMSDLHLNGGFTTLTACSPLVFDYTNAPANGCILALVASFLASDSTICIGTCINFSDLSLNASSWQWSFAGGTPPASTSEDPAGICYSTSGSFDVTLIVSNGSSNDTLILADLVNVSAGAIIPVLTQDGDTLIAPLGYASYQWYYQGNLISGATDNFYVAIQAGDYSVVVTDENGCEASANIKSVATGISLVVNGALSVFPNPATDKIYVREKPGETIRVFDLYGRNNTTFQVPPSGEITFDISAWPGFFFVRSSSGSTIRVNRY
jgi:PKD repeat protein